MSMEIMAPIIGFLAGILGGMVTAAVQYFASTKQEEAKNILDTRTDAYRSLMDAVVSLALYNGALKQAGVTEPTADQRTQLLAHHTALAAAQSKMALYATPDVMEKAGSFFSKHAGLGNDAAFESFIDMVQEMREDSFADCYPNFRQHLDELMLRKAMRA